MRQFTRHWAERLALLRGIVLHKVIREVSQELGKGLATDVLFKPVANILPKTEAKALQASC